MKHLTDYQIQELLSEENRLRKSFYDDHLSLCSKCREKLAEYKKLILNVEYADDIKISLDFTEKVLSRTKQLETQKSVYSILAFLLPFVFGASTLVVLEYFEIISLLPFAHNSIAFIGNIISTISTNLFSWLPSLNVSIELVAVSVVSIGLYHLLDLLLVKPRFR